MANKIQGWFDGACYNSSGGGQSAYGYYIEADEGDSICGARHLGHGTSNTAEYHGLINLLEKLVALGVKEAKVYGDSKLVIYQTKCKWRVLAPHLKPLFEQARSLAAKIPYLELKLIPREHNKVADRLAGDALKKLTQG